MKRQFSLNIDKPCTENFQEFDPTKAGGFCQSCQKEVIDFTKMSEREIIQYFANRKGKTCGRFETSQLTTYQELATPPQRQKVSFFGAGLLSFSLLALLPINQSKAQAIEPISVVQPVVLEATPVQSDKEEEGHLVNGIVLEKESQEPLIGASVVIKGADKGTLTNIDGKFKFDFRLQAGDVLLISFIGYETQTYTIPKDAPEKLEVKIEFSSAACAIMGEVAVEEVYRSKPTFWQRVKGAFQ